MRRGASTGAAGAAAAAALALAGCGGLRDLVAPPPPTEPSGVPGWLVYRVGALRLDAPGDWHAEGDERQVRLEAPGGLARLEVSEVATAFAGEKDCLAAAEAALERSAAQLERVRRHATTLAGRPAVVQEADAGGWHGWAWGLCAGARQYRVFFTGRSPIPAELLETRRTLLRSARLGGGA